MNDLYDSADEAMFERMCVDGWQQDLAREREVTTLEALLNCRRAGAKPDDLETLATELGLGRQWKQYTAART